MSLAQIRKMIEVTQCLPDRLKGLPYWNSYVKKRYPLPPHPSSSNYNKTGKSLFAGYLERQFREHRREETHLLPEEIRSVSELLGRMLEMDPAERISSHQALESEWFKGGVQPSSPVPVPV